MSDNQSTNDFICSYFGSVLGGCVVWQDGPVFKYPGCGMYAAQIRVASATTVVQARISDDLPEHIRHRLVGYCVEQHIPYEYATWPMPSKQTGVVSQSAKVVRKFTEQNALLREFRDETAAFNTECEAREHTDIGDAWDLFGSIHRRCVEALKPLGEENDS